MNEVKLIQISPNTYKSRIFEDVGGGYCFSKGQSVIVFYRYSYGCYEGDGDALVYIDGKWGYTTLDHCSCYGPEDRINDVKTEYSDPRDILKTASTEVFDFIRKCLDVGENFGIFDFEPITYDKKEIEDYWVHYVKIGED